MLGARPKAIHYWGAKFMGATLWCWIFWRLKHDWRDVIVSLAQLTSFEWSWGGALAFNVFVQGHHDSIEPPPLVKDSEANS